MFIVDQGWPTPNVTNQSTLDDMALRAYAYEVIGILAKSGPQELLVEPNLDLLRWLLRSLSEETSGKSVAMSIEDALATVMSKFTTNQDDSIRKELGSLLLYHMQLSSRDPNNSDDRSPVQRSTRFIATRFANRCLRYSDVVARWIDILAISHSPHANHELAEEGRRGLDPYWYRMLNPAAYGQDRTSHEAAKFQDVDFIEITKYILGQAHRDGANIRDFSPRSEAQRFLTIYPNAFFVAIEYIRQVFLTETLRRSHRGLTFDVDWDKKLDQASLRDEEVRNIIRQRIASAFAEEDAQLAFATELLLEACFEGSLKIGHPQSGAARRHLVEMCSLSPNALVSKLAPRAVELRELILSNDHSTRMSAAHAFGILASYSDHTSQNGSELHDQLGPHLQDFYNLIQSWRSAVGAEINKIHGAIIAQAFYHARLSARRQQAPGTSGTIPNVMSHIVDIVLSSTDGVLQEACHISLGQLSSFYVLSSKHVENLVSTEKLIQKIAERAKSGEERAVLTLGQLAMVYEEGSAAIGLITQKLYDFHELRQPETQFAVGEALSELACGWDSKALRVTFDLDAPVLTGLERKNQLTLIVDAVIEQCRTTKPSLKKASTIWLLCLLQFCGHRKEMQERLPQCQLAFKRGLSDRDELIQETASRGLGLVYETGDRSLKDELVRDLIGSFSDNKSSAMAGTVSEDTQLFEPGQLPTGEKVPSQPTKTL